MQQLKDIAVKVTLADGVLVNHANALPILHEILHALQLFSNEGKGTIIDLHSLPFGPGDEDELLRLLGRGEVSVVLQSLGESTLWETAYSGVWLIDHRNAEGERIALQVEIGQIPQILLSPQDDIADAITQLETELNTENPAQ